MLLPMTISNVLVKLSSSTFKTRILGSVYQPPNNNLDLFMSGFESVRDHFNHLGVECLIARDFNIDLLKYNVHRGIFTNKSNKIMLSGILIADISDHLPVFYISVSNNKTNIPKFTIISSRSITDQHTLVLKNELTNTDWSSVY